MQAADFVVANPDLTQQIALLQRAVSQLVSLGSHLTLGMTTAHGLEYLKKTPAGSRVWALLQPRGKAVAGGVLAFLGSLGITAAFHPDPSHPGVITIVLSGVTATSIGQHVWSFIQSWVLQQGWYQAVIQPKTIVGTVPAKGAPPVVPVVVTEQKG